MIAHNYLTLIHPLALGLLWIWTKLITHNVVESVPVHVCPVPVSGHDWALHQ